MKKSPSLLIKTASGRSSLGWIVLRVALASLIAAHGWARLITGGIEPFGAFLDGQGFPLGIAWAATITGVEIAGSILLALGQWVLPLSLLYSSIYATGILLVHAKAGWFVVGLGRNGSEYSVLLIVCLLCVGLQHVSSRSEG